MLFRLRGRPRAARGGEKDGGPMGPPGTRETTTATTGDPGEDYTVIVDGASPRTIAATATLTIPDVEVGSHVVLLTLPTGCILEGENPRTIAVTESATATTAFIVTCS